MSNYKNIFATNLHASNTITGPTIDNINSDINQRALLTDGRFSDPHKIIVKSANVGTGEFSSIAAAAASITDASSSNPYVIQVGPGVFSEPEIVLPAYVSVVGSAIDETYVQPVGNNNLFIVQLTCEVSFMTLQNVPTGYKAIVCDDIGDFAQAHKLSIYNCDIGVYVRSRSQDTFMYLEYIDINGVYSYGIVVESTNGYIALLNTENFYMFPDPNVGLQNHISASGSKYDINITVGQIMGVGAVSAVSCSGAGSLRISTYEIINTSTSVFVEDGAQVDLRGLICTDSTNGILVGTNGAPPNLNASGCSFKNCTRNVQINNLDTTGSIDSFSEYAKTFINEHTPCGVVGSAPHTIRVAPSGADFSSVYEALQYVNPVVTDAVTTNGSTTLTSASGAFTPVMTFLTITGAGIPDGTTATYIDNNTITLSQAATASATITATFIRATFPSPFNINISSGYFAEPPLVLPPFTTLNGENPITTVIGPDNASNPYVIQFITGNTLVGLNVDGQLFNFNESPLLFIQGCPAYCGFDQCIFSNAKYAIKINSSVNEVDAFQMLASIIFNVQTYLTVDGTLATAGGVKPITVIGSDLTMLYTVTTAQTIFDIRGPLCFAAISSVTTVGTGTAGSYGIYLEDGPNCQFNSCAFQNYDTGCRVGPTGDGPTLNLNANFLNCTRDVQIDNPATTGIYFGPYNLSKTYIHSGSGFAIKNLPVNTLTVSAVGGDYTSVADALAAINPIVTVVLTNGSSTITSAGLFNPTLDSVMITGSGIPANTTATIVDNSTMTLSNNATVDGTSTLTFTRATATSPFVIRVFNGTFTESSLVVPDYVSIVGYSNAATTLTPANPNNDHFLYMGKVCNLENIQISGTTGGIAVLIDSNQTSPTDQGTKINSCVFLNNQTAIKMTSTTARCEALITDCVFNNFTNGILIDGTMANTTYQVEMVMMSSYFEVVNDSDVCFNIMGPNAEMFASACNTDGNNHAYTGLELSDGASATFTGCEFAEAKYAVHILNSGAAPDLRLVGCSLENNTDYDIFIEHPGTNGVINGVAERSKVSINASAPISANYTDPVVNGTTVLGNLFLGDTNATTVDVSDLIREVPALGLITGGALSINSGRVLNISGGVGYVGVGSFPSTLKKFIWTSTTITVTANSTMYIYIDSSGTLTQNASKPTPIETILLGRVNTDSSNIVFIDSTAVRSYHMPNTTNVFNREVFGAIFASGSIVTVDSSLQIAVSSGVYYYGNDKFTPSGASSPLTFTTFYHSSGAWTKTTGVTTVDNLQYDDGTNLANIPNHYYAKHSLYLVGDGGNERYFLVYSQDQYSSLGAAQGAALPLPPPYFTEGVVLIASIIVSEDDNTFSEVSSQRPLPSFSASAISSTIYHSSLLGLDQDDHKQYLLVDGTRAMAANLDMGGNNITNINLVDGVDVSSHASRHLPNGADPLAVAAPTTIIGSTTSNAAGSANSFSRSDHFHAVNLGSFEINQLGATVPLSVAKGGTGVTTLTNGNFVIGAGTGGVTTTKPAPAGTVVGTTDTQTLTNKTITDASNTILAFPKIGNVIVVDKINGNDSTGAIGGLPFQSIGAALAVATSGYDVFVYPGTYAESGLTVPANVCLYGADTLNTVISTSVTTNTVGLTMGTNSRLDRITINLSSSTPGITLTGILLSGSTSSSVKLRVSNVSVTNTTTGNATLYGLRISGSATSSSTLQTTSSMTITANAPNATSGNARAIYIDGANSVSIRDTSLSATGGAGISAVGVETNNSSASFRHYGVTCTGTTADYLQTAGNLAFYGVTGSAGSSLFSRTSNQLILGASTNTTTLTATSTGARTLTFPDITDTIVTKNTSDTMTNKTITGSSNTVSANYLKSATTEINVSSATAPTSGQLLIATSSTSAVWQDPSTLTTVPSVITEISSTAANSTTATSYSQLGTPLTVTPAAGTYLVIFSSTLRLSNGLATANYIIDVAGTTVAHSARTAYAVGKQGDQSYMSAHTMAKVTVNGSQAVSVLFKTSAGTLTVTERALELITST